MANERIATYSIGFGGDDTDFRSFLNSIKTQAGQTIASIEALGKKITLFDGVGDQVTKANAALVTAKNNVDILTKAIQATQAAGTPTKELEAGLKRAQTELSATQKAFDRSVDSLTRLQSQLSRAGVDTRNLAAESTRLAAAQTALAAAATDAAAKQVLGLKTVKDIQPQINQAYAAYNTLIASSVLSQKEAALAQTQLNARVAELKGQVTGVGVVAKTAGPDLAGMFRNSILPAVGLTASIAGVVGILKEALEKAHEFEHGVEEIGTVTNLTKAQLDALGDGARRLAIELGGNVTENLKALFELIRSGVPAENALTVLEVSARAARAALTDVGTGAKAANLLLDAFDADAADLPLLFDKIIAGAHNGGATLKEFAESAGPLLNVARAAGRSFDDVLAALTVLVDKSGNAGKSFTDLTKILAKLETTDARNKLRELGITGDSLVEIFQQIGARGLTLGDVLGIDLTGAGVKSAASLAALTSNSGELPGALDKITKAAGTTKEALDKLQESGGGQRGRLSAAFQDSLLTLGNVADKIVAVGRAAGLAVNPLNDLAITSRQGSVAGTLMDNSFGRVVASFFGLVPASVAAKDGVTAVGTAASDAATRTADLTRALTRARSDLASLATQLLASVQAIQSAGARDVADATARADAQIAALDRSVQASGATAAATLAIRLKLSTELLAIIAKEERDVTTAVEAGAAARLDGERKAGKTEQQISLDTAQLRIQALGPVLAQYQAHYNSLIALAQNELASARGIEQARLDLNKSIEDQIRQVRIDSLTGLDQYVAKLAEVDRLVSEGRKAAALNDTATAKQYFQDAIAASNGLTTVVKADGTVLISATQSLTDRQNKLKGIQDAVNESFGDTGNQARTGAAKAIAAANDVQVKIQELQRTYDDLKRSVTDGLSLRVVTDQDSVNAATAILNELTRPRTVQITVQTTQANAAGGLIRAFAGGGAVAQAYAQGGGVFRRPGYSKVPGSGDGDTVPALLPAGSFVMRKRAVADYGDSRMARLAHAYASGGGVPFSNFTTFAPPAAKTPESPYFGSIQSGAVRQGGPLGSAPQLPSDPKEKLKAIMRYVDEVRTAARSVDGIFFWQRTFGELEDALRFFAKAPTDDNLDEVLAAARSIGLNIGLSKGKMQGFDIDGRKFHEIFGERPSFGGVGSEPIGAVYEFYAKGGKAVGDTVPAWLTPGEVVINEPAVRAVTRRFGGGFLDAVNQSRISPAALDSLMNLPAPRRPRGYADGGYVDSVRPAAVSAVGGGAKVTELHVHVSKDDLDQVEKVRRVVLPIINDINRRNGTAKK